MYFSCSSLIILALLTILRPLYLSTGLYHAIVFDEIL